MSLEKSTIIKGLRKVLDPTSGQSIVLMNRVKDIQIDGNNVNVSLELPALEGKQKADINFACIGAVKEVYPDAEVNIHLISSISGAEKPASPMAHVKNIIAVGSGKGGVGKSTVSVNLALGLKKMGAKVGLIDADLYGPSIPTMLGLKGKRPKIQQVYNQPKILPLEAFGISVMSIGFIIEPEQAVVLRGPRLGGIIKQFFNDTIWPELDYLIVDLPPGTGDIQLTLVQTVPVTGAVMVTTPQEVAVADAVKAMNMFLLPTVNVPILGVVENMSWFSPAELPDNKYYLFGKGGGKQLSKLSNSMLLGQVPIVQSIREGGDTGSPVITKDIPHATDAFMKIAENVARQIALRNEMIEPTRIVKVQN